MKINPIIYILVAVIILAGLFIVFKPKDQEPASQLTQNLQQAPVASPIPDTSKNFEIIIKDKKIISAQSTISVTEGDEVSLIITSDEPEEFHLHAYGNSVDLEASVSAELKFTADKTGRFPFELEKSQTELGAVEVLPK